MSATELMERFEQAQREGFGDEVLEVTPEQAERLHELVEGHHSLARNATTVPPDGRLLFVRG